MYLSVCYGTDFCFVSLLQWWTDWPCTHYRRFPENAPKWLRGAREQQSLWLSSQLLCEEHVLTDAKGKCRVVHVCKTASWLSDTPGSREESRQAAWDWFSVLPTTIGQNLQICSTKIVRNLGIRKTECF